MTKTTKSAAIGSPAGITVESPAKINLSIDVVGKRPDGMHEVDMIMQSIDFCDEVTVTVGPAACPETCAADCPGDGITITCNVPGVPTDRANICWKAAELMRGAANELFGSGEPAAAGSTGSAASCAIAIDIRKRIPVAAGMAGGSGNGAAVLHALNKLWGLGLSTVELMRLGGKLGADVPFCVLAQEARSAGAAADPEAGAAADPSAKSAAARARGTGTEITKVSPFTGYVTFAKPPIGVSTKEAYKGIDSCEIVRRPDNDRLAEALAAGGREAAAREMINVLELYTLEAEPEVARLKQLMESKLTGGAFGAEKVLMSGSGPTVFALFGEDGKEAAEKARDLLRELKYEAYSCRL